MFSNGRLLMKRYNNTEVLNMADNPSITPSSTDDSTDSLDSRTRDAVADGLVELLKPAVEEIDDRVKTVRDSQVELRQQIDCLADDLKKIAEQQAVPVDLEPYVKKLNNSRRRVMLVNNILQNVQERLTKLYNNVSKETARRKTLLDSPSPGPPH